ncbi:hypothetical protein UF10_03700 [Peptostreptococcus russellii]|uniref:HTH cro/C1-type domain-containing protein n=1 Tax=Peptostreptococcus russellii TaxID=215200 RepID=A0A2P7Q1A8_9FIRM|nr:hypothetical protein [Peptostreptococcus russellii]PSJ31742.1 hypothetical protein UF10_03700 [Peptostreptococcus russellii]
MNKIRKIMNSKDLTIDILAAALNISDYDLELAIDSDELDIYLDGMQIEELIRVLDVDSDEIY